MIMGQVRGVSEMYVAPDTVLPAITDSTLLALNELLHTVVLIAHQHLHVLACA